MARCLNVVIELMKTHPDKGRGGSKPKPSTVMMRSTCLELPRLVSDHGKNRTTLDHQDSRFFNVRRPRAGGSHGATAVHQPNEIGICGQRRKEAAYGTTCDPAAGVALTA